MAIQIIKQSHITDRLMPRAGPAKPLTQSPCKTKDLSIALDGAGANDQGVWECTPGSFERQIESAEVMHILTGSATFTPVGGEPVSFGAGDTVFFPKNTFGVWEIKETVRKVYAIFSGV